MLNILFAIAILLSIVFFFLKLLGVIVWSWLYIISPAWIYVVILIMLILMFDGDDGDDYAG